MKRQLWLLLLPILFLSLWFNWRAFRQSGTRADAPKENSPLSASPAAAQSGPVLPEAIDFTGTGFDEQAWKLDPATPSAPIPDQIPAAGLPAAPALPAEWDPALQLSPAPSSGPK